MCRVVATTSSSSSKTISCTHSTIKTLRKNMIANLPRLVAKRSAAVAFDLFATNTTTSASSNNKKAIDEDEPFVLMPRFRSRLSPVVAAKRPRALPAMVSFNSDDDDDFDDVVVDIDNEQQQDVTCAAQQTPRSCTASSASSSSQWMTSPPMLRYSSSTFYETSHDDMTLFDASTFPESILLPTICD